MITRNDFCYFCITATMIIILSREQCQVRSKGVAGSLIGACPPNPPSLTASQLSGPFDTCDQDIKNSLVKSHPDQNRNTGEVLEAYGYPFKEYKVTTMDDYILTVYRITGSPNKKKAITEKKQAVYIQHGLAAASDSWFFQPGNRNFPFKLADAGYEVWLGNARGTSYSTRHNIYNSEKDLEYWNFSWHEMGIFDIPAVTETILKESKNEKIFYVGHSMGTSQYFVALSEIPSMNDKILAGFMFAPIAFIGHMNSPLRHAFPLMNTDTKYEIVNFVLQGRLQSFHDIRHKLGLSIGDVCEVTAAKCGVCDNLVFALFGYNAPQMNNTELPNFWVKIPNTMSVKTMAHYAQIWTSCKFQKYDYGEVINKIVYGSTTPPDYNFQNVKAPTYFFYGDQDNLGPPNDVSLTASKFRRGVININHRVNSKLWNHIDFYTAKDADKLLYDLVLKEMNKIKIERL